MTPLAVGLAEPSCPAADPSALPRAIYAAEQAVGYGDPVRIHQAVSEGEHLVVCLRTPLDPALAYRLHVVAGVDAIDQGDRDLARRHFWTAQVLHPGPPELTQAAAVREAWTPPLPSEPVEPARTSILVDGTASTAIPVARPCVVQSLEGGAVVRTELRFPDAEVAALDLERDRAEWAVADLELAWQFLELRVAGGYRAPAVRFQALVRDDLATARDVADRVRRSLLAAEAHELVLQASARAAERWDQLDAVAWDRLGFAEQDLLALHTARASSASTLAAPADPGVDLVLERLTAETYGTPWVHTAQYHAEQAGAIRRGERPSGSADLEPVVAFSTPPKPVLGLADLPELDLLAVEWPSAGGLAVAGLEDPFAAPPRATSLEDIHWDEVPAGLLPIDFR